jgi:hypothetical protein
MNANEFADELEKAPTLWFKDDVAGKWIIEKLRQQQAEIEALKEKVMQNADLEEKVDFCKEKLEPVAWMEYIQGEEWEVWFVEPTDLPKGHTYRPLYTHPVKELTDEEIRQVIFNLPNKDLDLIEFAKAILRKAQEK